MCTLRPRVTATIALLLAYLLFILPFTPFAVSARPRSKPAASTQQKSPARYRDGELLVRFRDGVSRQDKETIIAAHGARRMQQLEGDSGFEKLELPAGRDAKAAVLQLLLNPQVEFAEANFIISREDLTSNDPQFKEQWGATKHRSERRTVWLRRQSHRRLDLDDRSDVNRDCGDR